MSIKPKNNQCSNYPISIVDEEWEYIDPTPDIHALFIQYDDRFFWGKLRSVELKWSARMTVCAGLCRYEGRRSGHCSISLSVPLLKLRPRKDLVETLLHEMIHAFLFLTNNNRDRDGHGPEFQSHMHRINHESGTRITIYHSFHDEVRLYKQHWWKCNGPCQHRRPFYGLVKRSMNRAPGPNDLWWAEHQASCGGTFTKIKEPEGYGEKKKKATTEKKTGPDAKKPKIESPPSSQDIRGFLAGAGQAKIESPPSSQDIRGFLAGAGPSQSPKLREITNGNKKTNITSPPSGSKDIRGFFKTSNGYPSPAKPSQSSTSSPKFSSNNVFKPTSSAKGKSLAGSAVMMKNRGSSTITVKGSITSAIDSSQPTTAKPTQGGIVSVPASRTTFVPFAGTGKVLGSSGTRAGPSGLLGNRIKTEHALPPHALPSSSLKKTSISPTYLVTPKVETVILDDSQEESPASGDNVPCPVCGAHFRLVEMNSHLDSCLS